MYYKRNENGIIAETCTIALDENWQYTEENIVFSYAKRQYVFASDIDEQAEAEAMERLEEQRTKITLEQAKQNKIAELKHLRDAEELSPIEYGGYRWDFDEKAQMRINGAITILGDGTFTWTSADNQEIKGVNADDLKGVISQAAIRSNRLHIKYRELKAQVEACENIEAVEAIVW